MLSEQSKKLINEIAKKIKAADSEKTLIFAVRHDENYRNDYLAIRDELPKLVGDDNNFYAIRLIDKDITNYVRYFKENDSNTPPTKKRSICVYLSQNEGEFDELKTAISGENEFLIMGQYVRTAND